MKTFFTQFLVSFILLLASQASFANTITVCASGCNQTTIQNAVNAAASGDTILVNINGAITENGISISKNLVIRGLGQNTTIVQAHAVRGSATHRVFYIAGGVNVTIENLTIQNGKETADPTAWNGSGCGIMIDGTSTIVTLNSVTVKNCDNVGAGGAGAGITLGGTTTTLYLNNCLIEGNVATTGSAAGLYLSANNGVCQARNTIFNSNTAYSSGGATFLGGTITASFINCTFSNNQAASGGSGGAIYASSAIPVIYSCTFSGNTAAGQGGALRIGGASITNSTFYSNTAVNGGAISRGTSAATNAVQIVNCTISGNAATGAAPAGAGLQNASTTALIHMANTVIANSTTGSDLYLNTASTLSTNQRNYVGTASFTTGSTTFSYNSGANLSAPANNGGLTSTLAVLPGSVLINNGAAVVAGLTIPTKDQRNLPLSGTIDIGAYEYNASETMSISYTALANTSSNTSRTLQVNINDNIGVPTSGGFMPRIHFKKNSGNWVSSPGTLSSGTAQSGVWTFTISYSQVGGINSGEVISYFIAAQDNTLGAYAKSNLSGLIGGSVSAVTTPPASPNTYTYSLSTLPIKLVSFQAVPASGGINISWETVEYGDTERYELFKSTNGTNFSLISSHNPNTAGVYSFVDQAAGNVCYYRLKMIEKNGTVSYSKVLFLRTNQTSVRLQTNIINGNTVSVRFDNKHGKVSFALIDMNGRLLSRGNMNAGSEGSVQSIATGNIAPGKYYLELMFDGSVPVILPFIKE
jgi:predicted outer membrane repeat protein